MCAVNNSWIFSGHKGFISHDKWYSGKKKETFHPETGPEVIKSRNFLGPIIHWCKKDLSHINRKKLFCLFRGGKFLFWGHCIKIQIEGLFPDTLVLLNFN